MRSFKTWLVEKEWDNTKFFDSDTNNPIVNAPARLKAIAVGYNSLDSANRFVEQLNQECKSCPRRAALHTVYRVIEPAVNVRIITADDTYQQKLKEQQTQQQQQ